jgi:hypothetical protein
MSVKRSRTLKHGQDKIKLLFEYGLDELTIYTYYNTVYVRYKGVNGYDASNKLLKLFYEMLDMDIPQIEKALGVKITSEGIRDKAGNRAEVISL